jgi:iron complex outermembrane receptor protein
MDYTDVQVPGSVGVDTDGDGVADTFTGVTTNAGEATLRGVEFELSGGWETNAFVDGDYMSVNATVGLLDGEYDQFINAFGQDISDQASIQNTPDTTASLSLGYSMPVYSGELNLLSTVSYRSDSQQFELASPLIDQDAYTLWNASAVWTSDEGTWSAGLYGRNLTDERYKVAGYDFVDYSSNSGPFVPTLGLEGTLTAFYGDPRTVTASVTYRY